MLPMQAGGGSLAAIEISLPRRLYAMNIDPNRHRDSIGWTIMNETKSNEHHGVLFGCSCCAGGIHQAKMIRQWSRRGFLATGIAGALATTLALPQRARAQSTLSPDAALQALLDGNKRFAEKRLTSVNEDLAILQQNTVAKQEPFAGVLACADSRVPVELVFDQTIGHLFVARVAGNVATSEIIASLEYGAAVLGTKAILVLGHANCGAIKATIEGKAEPGQISQLYAPIRPAVEAAGSDPTAVSKANAKFQAHLLATASPLLAGLIKEAKLKIAAGYFDLATGTVSLVG
jgi:carbonic anhydrase